MIEFKLTHGAKLPRRGSKLSSGWDLEARGFSILRHGTIQNTIWFDDSSLNSVTINPQERILIHTGLHVNLSEPHFESDTEFELTEMQIRPRSGLAAKYGLTVLNAPGTIDNEYTDEIGVILYNTSTRSYTINNGERIAQAVLCFVKIPKESGIKIVEEFSTHSDRGGFGSTGK